MKRLFLLCLTLLMAGSAMAQDAMPTMGAPEEMGILEDLAGDWDVTFKFRGSPEMAWQETKATSTNTMVLDGCCFMSEFRGSMMGMPMKGINLMSYNRNTGNWQNSWVDNMTASISYLEGPMQDGAIVLRGEDSMAGTAFATRITQYNMSAGSYDWKMEMSMDDGANWFEMATAKYTRKKASEKTDDGGW